MYVCGIVACTQKKPACAPPFLNPLKSYRGQPGRRRFGLDDDDEEQRHSGKIFFLDSLKDKNYFE